jgi:hypothetical protein
LRGHLLQIQHSPAALADYREALQLFKDAAEGINPGTLRDFHQRFGDHLLNLASMRRERPADQASRRILSEALVFYLTLGENAAADGDRAQAAYVVDNLSLVSGVRDLPEIDRRQLRARLQSLQQAVQALPSKGK